jgi:hypothetical protein
MIRSSILDNFLWKFAYSLIAFYLVFTQKLGIPFQVYFRVRHFDYSWLLQENGISMCSNGKNVRRNTVPMSRIEPGTPALTVRCIIHDHIHPCVKSIPKKIENLSLKTLQMEEVGNFFLKKMLETYHMSLKLCLFSLFIYDWPWEKCSQCKENYHISNFFFQYTELNYAL